MAEEDFPIQEGEWTPWSPMFKSHARVGEFLGTDYTTGVDCRWKERVSKGPQFNVVDCASVGGTTANFNGLAIITVSAVVYGYGIRGTDPVRIKLSDMTITDPGISLAERATSVIYTKNTAALEEITFGMLATAYRVITTFTPAGSDTHGANSGSEIIRIFAAAPERIVGLQAQKYRGNVIDSTVSMVAPAWQTVAEFTGPNIVPTGFAIDGTVHIWGTNMGPLIYDTRSFKFRPQVMLVAPDLNNCRNMSFSPYIGVVIPMTESVMASQSGYLTTHIGPEAYVDQRSPVLGYPTALDRDLNWDMMAYFDPLTSTTYILAGRPRQEDDWHSEEVSWYCIGTQTTACEHIQYINKQGGRTNPTWMGGSDDDFWYMLAGRTSRWFDDSNYRYATASQAWYGTEVDAGPGTRLTPRWFAFEVENTTPLNTIALSIEVSGSTSIDGGSSTVIGTANFGDGLYRIDLSPAMAESLTGRAIRPVLTFVNSANTTTPVLRSKLRWGFQVKPGLPV